MTNALLVSLCLALFGRLCSEEPSRPDQAYADLLKRAADGHFKSLWKLRTVGDKRAVPVLAAQLPKYRKRGNVTHMFLLETLFAIGGEEVDEIVRKEISSQDYDIEAGLEHATNLICWGAWTEQKRGAFIEKYLLSDLSKEIQLDLKASARQAGGEHRLDFTLAFTNKLGRAVNLHLGRPYWGKRFAIRPVGGHFARWCQISDIDWTLQRSAFVEIAPGNAHRLQISGKLYWMNFRKGIKPTQYQHFRHLRGRRLVLEFDDEIMFCLGQPGRFEIYAAFFADSWGTALGRRLGVPAIWTGRTVSKPILVDIPDPEADR